MDALTKLRNAGFSLVIGKGEFLVSPGDLVTETVKGFIQKHSDEIGQELERERRQRRLMDAEREANRIIQQLMKRNAGVRP
jgi:hypothetical protein